MNTSFSQIYAQTPTRETGNVGEEGNTIHCSTEGKSQEVGAAIFAVLLAVKE